MKLWHGQDQKATGTAGGASSAGWQTRVINTEVTDQIGVTLSSNQITLPAGNYYIEATAPSYQGAHNQLRLRNVTDGVTLVQGANAHGYTDATSQVSIAHIQGYFSIAAGKAIELQHYISQAKTVVGLGSAVSATGEQEIYANVVIWQL